MTGSWEDAGRAAAASHPRAREDVVQYGTAGFRTKAELLDHVLYRMGLLAVLRSRAKQGAAIGVMVTASHNPAPDNGVKLVDPAGEMLEAAWEPLATRLANCPDSDLPVQLAALETELELSGASGGTVILGRDTRPSSPALAAACLAGVAAAGGVARDLGVVTTPQLHYLVVATNTNGGYGDPSLPGYYDKICGAFKKFMGLVGPAGSYNPSIVFDGANGVGAAAMLEFQARLAGVLQCRLVNTGEGELNSGCGADFVKVSQAGPAGLGELQPGRRCVSVDGDADRVVYYYTNQAGQFRLLDGDRIASLVAAHIQQLLAAAGLGTDLRLGLVQTAYANGGSTRYIGAELGVPVTCTPTGVKHLHHAALQFDVGVYFEANGHGTVVFSEKAVELIRARGGEKLSTLLDVVNQTVGDAISDLLVVECVLADRGWDCPQWDSCYQDLPNRLGKVAVRDRTLVTTEDAERRVVTPAGLQQGINAIVAEYSGGRSFVRPSGTEDCVRVYSEAETREAADTINTRVSQLVVQMIG